MKFLNDIKTLFSIGIQIDAARYAVQCTKVLNAKISLHDNQCVTGKGTVAATGLL